MPPMLDVAALRRVRLSRVPYGQLVVKQLMMIDFRFPRRTEIVLEGVENLPGHPVCFAMNHTDRYNYWPFQYELARRGLGFTATWVKGKYYEHPWIARFLGAMNNIPVPSRGYLLTGDLRAALGRLPESEEYRQLRDLVDGRVEPGSAALAAAATLRPLLGETTESQRAYLRAFIARFDALAREVVRLNRLALGELGLHVLVFPEGTRSKTLRRGHTGLAQMAGHLSAAVVPVGCSGCDLLYPGNSPMSQGGRVVYRIGKPLEPGAAELAPFAVPSNVLPFTAEAARWDHCYRGVTDLVMGRIAELVDPPYRPQAEAEAAGGGEVGSRRFI